MSSSKARYARPEVQTLSADRIVELMGPVSCGSGMHPLPSDDGLTGHGFSGNQNFQR